MTSPATQELESAMAKLRKSAAAEQNHRLSEAEAAALLQHIAALQSQLDTAQKDNLARHRQCGELRTEVAALTQRVEAADKLIDRCLELVRGDIEQFGPCDHSVGCCICGEVRLADDIAAYRALSQEPRNG